MHSTRTRPKPSPERERGAAGFTILETVIALFVALVVGFGAISMFLFASNFNAGASDRARALALAQQTMESLRAQDFDALAVADVTQALDVGSAAAGVADKRTFNVRTQVENDAAVTGSKQKIVTVTVTPANAGRWSGGPVVLKMLRTTDDVGTLP